MSYISNEYASYTRVGNMYEEDINFIQINFSYGLSSGNKFIPIMKTKQEEYMIQNENNEKYVKNFKIIETNSMGIIDNSYCGDNDQWFFPAYALEDTIINKNDRICQFRIMEKQPKINFEEVNELKNPDRGGHGSTGVQ